MQILRDSSTLSSTVSQGDGSFAIADCPPGATVTASLAGFETATVPCADARRIVMRIARATEGTEVTASADAESPTSAGLGTEIGETTLARLPLPTYHAREALPLLPSVVRGSDGLLRIDGVRPHESPLLYDGFNVADPATGLSSIDPPIESVANVQALRDPMAVTFGRGLGSMASIETKTGGDKLDAGIQSFLPRPRLSPDYGFFTLEGFSPRAHVGGRAGAVRYFAAAEYDFNRYAVPGVTTSSGTPDRRDTAATLLGRADVTLADTHVLTVEGLVFPANRKYQELSPLRTPEASPTLINRDVFGGVVDRHSYGANDEVTLRLGYLSHHFEEQPNNPGQPEITPLGWSGGLFSSTNQTANRLEGSAAWQRKLRTSSGLHELTLQASVETSSLSGAVAERTVDIRDAAGDVVRAIRFGAPASIAARDRNAGIALRDLWTPSERLSLDFGVRQDWSELGGSAPSARFGVRYKPSDALTIGAGVGEFVGSLPLSVPAFADYPVRFDETLDPKGGASTTTTLQPTVSQLSLPRALAANARVERQIAPGWDVSLGVSLRDSSHLATLDVLPAQGSMLVTSTGESTYRSAEAVVRHRWGRDDQILVSYTRSLQRGDTNDFSSLFALGDVEVLQPGAVSRLSSDAPHRLLAWGTFTLPAGFSIAPAVDWHSGFPYSVLDPLHQYVGSPNSHSYPPFFSLDVIVYKALTISGRHVKLNVQVFNATNHFNPRDVFNVTGAAQFGTFTNSVGPTFRGDVSLNW